MSEPRFVHLRLHTAYSLAEGAISVKELIKQCQGLKIPAVAVTDTNNMFAALEFSTLAQEAGVQPIIGVTLSVRDDLTADGQSQDGPACSDLVLLAATEQGYRRLMVLVSKAYLESDPLAGPSLALSEILTDTDGLICLSGGAGGPLGACLLDRRAGAAKTLAAAMKGAFGDRFYIELMRHGSAEEEATEEGFLDLAYDLDIPLVATNRPYFLSRDFFDAHDTLLCIADSRYVNDTDRRKLNPEYRLKSEDEMLALFADLPEATENTVRITQRCRWRVPIREPLLPNFTGDDAVSEGERLSQVSEAGLRVRLEKKAMQENLAGPPTTQDWAKPYWDRLAYELSVIQQMGFPGYFLIVADFIQWAKDHNIPVGPGRGSGAGSVVAWALMITDLDPLKFSLLFERFLNPERISMPDFDVDFCQEKRDQVIRYVQDKYGHDRVAQIITFGKLQARAVVKACGRVLQQPYPKTDHISKMIPNDPANPMTLSQAIAYEPRLRQEMENDDETRLVIERALKLEGLYAHSSTHAAGVVIGDRPLDQLVPLYRDPKSDMPVTQFNMKWVEQAGLVKFDFLGLKTLTVLDRAVELVRKRGIDLDLSALPLDDARSYALLARGDTAGVFQLESTGMRSALKGLKPDTFEDIIAIVALYRPGPMDNIPTYVKRKHGLEPVAYPHEMLVDILSETYGVIIYQEQVMQIAQTLSGYSLGEADLLRRAMGKKIQAEMDKQRGRFCDGAVERGIDAVKAGEIFDLVAKFASYGFNKSHAAAYALVAYQTAYMKANFPVEFMSAIMTLDINNTDKLSAFKEELRDLGIPLLLPDINSSMPDFSVEAAPEPYCDDAADPRQNLAVRYALAAVKNVGSKATERIVEERQAHGRYADLFDLAERLDPALMNRRSLENLAASGAFDGLVADRARAHAAADILLKYSQSARDERASAQGSLFGEAGAELSKPSIPAVRAWTSSELLEYEKKAVGFYISAHPLDSYAGTLEREAVISAEAAIASLSEPGEKTVKLAGAIDGFRQAKARKSGRKFGAFTLSDHSCRYEVLVFEDDLPQAHKLVEAGGPLLVTAQVRMREGDEAPRLSVRSMQSLEDAASQSGTGLLATIEDAAALSTVKNTLALAAGGRGKVTLHVRLSVPDFTAGHLAAFELPGRYKVTPALCQAIAAEPGVSLVEEV